MELRQVRLFLAAAEEGSITAAARRMNLTQPALSRQIKALEEELGVELFTRGAHSVTLTPAGRVLAEEGKKLLDRAERAAAAAFLAGRVSGILGGGDADVP
jgi:DNA-binding transcriptional LysR family regulator